MDKYTKEYLQKIKKAKNDQELVDIINNIYADGWDDSESSTIKQ